MKDNGFDIAGAGQSASPPARGHRGRAVLGALLFAAGASSGAEVRVQLSDAEGQPLADAVVALRPTATATGGMPGAAADVTMAQERQEFTPGVLSVSRGTRVRFPNRDDTQHHVYSFSPAKVFELPLYKGDTPEPVTFDKPGVVALGCNIHDHMRGFIFVADTPHHGLSDATGTVILRDLPPADYELVLWHARELEPGIPEVISVEPADRTISRSIAVAPPPKPVIKGLKSWVAQ